MRTSSRTAAARRRRTRSGSWPRRAGAPASSSVSCSSTRWNSSATSRCPSCRSFAGSGEVRKVPTKAVPAVARARRLPPIRLDRLARFAPSRRSLLVGLAVLAVVLGGYAVARETSLFAIHRIDIRGGSAVVDAQVAHVLAPFVGKSLVGLDGGAVL